MWLPLRQDSELQLGTEGQEEKDHRNWSHGPSPRRPPAFQERFPVRNTPPLALYRSLISSPDTLSVLFSSIAREPPPPRKRPHRQRHERQRFRRDFSVTHFTYCPLVMSAIYCAGPTHTQTTLRFPVCTRRLLYESMPPSFGGVCSKTDPDRVAYIMWAFANRLVLRGSDLVSERFGFLRPVNAIAATPTLSLA